MQQQQQQGRQPQPLPSKLEQLRTEQLEQLLTVEAALKQYIIEHVSTVPAARTLRDIQARNVELAQDNLNMQGTIEELRNHVAVVRSSEFSTAQAAFGELQQRQAKVLEDLGGPVLLERLAQDTAKLDNSSLALEDDLLAGRLAVDGFVEAYLAQRTAYQSLDLRRQVAEFSLL